MTLAFFRSSRSGQDDLRRRYDAARSVISRADGSSRLGLDWRSSTWHWHSVGSRSTRLFAS
ncbi:hypothetical protein AX769_01130 [Frondihabitans sp. PAMC 28766]|nr:hypothetical protein AX769_01130 [Frondihabitans sp. PAMC 28766]